MKKLHYTSTLLQTFAIGLAFSHNIYIGVIVLILSLALAMRFRLRAKLGVFENIEQMALFQKQEAAARLHIYRHVPHQVCTFCGQPFKKHKLGNHDVVQCPEVRQ